ERIDPKLGHIQHVRGNLVEQLVHATLAIGETCRFFRCLRQVAATHTAEECFEIALFEQLAGLLPALLAGYGDFIKVAAGSTGREYEGTLEATLTARDGSGAVAVPQRETI